MDECDIFLFLSEKIVIFMIAAADRLYFIEYVSRLLFI